MECLKCDICDKSFTGMICYQQHENSDKHKKKMRLFNGASPGTTDAAQIRRPEQQFHCSICSIYLYGITDYQKHVNSLEHAQMIQKQNEGVINQVKFEPAAILNNSLGAYAECKACQKQFSGPEPYQQHLDSSAHKKKCNLQLGIQKAEKEIGEGGISNQLLYGPKPSNVNQVLSNTPESSDVTDDQGLKPKPIVYLNDSVAAYAECKPCRKLFSGPEPYRQHLDSATHKKKCGLHSSIQMAESEAEKQKMLNDRLPFDPELPKSASCSTNTTPFMYAKCETCQMQFTGPQPYQLHLESAAHKKKSAIQPQSNADIAENQKIIPIFLNCNTCDKQFTGPIPYEQHIKSDVHRKKLLAEEFSKKFAKEALPSHPDSTMQEESGVKKFQNYYCDVCNKQCSGPLPYNSHIVSQDHCKKIRNALVESNLRKIKELGQLPPTTEFDPKLSLEEVTSTEGQISKFETFNDIKGSAVDSNLNNLNACNTKQTVLSKKFLSDPYDLIYNNALPNLNVISPENLDVTIFGIDEDIVFNNEKKKSNPKLLSQISMNESLNNYEES